jgi:NodT family efflux transporter outer membrane factor (OMF) lipoprotein
MFRFKVSQPDLRQTIAVALCALLSLGCAHAAVAQLTYFRNGCKVGPEYCRPLAPVASRWIDEGNPHISTWAQREQLWWISFNDPALNALIQSAYGQSLTLRSAGMRVLQARAQRDIASGSLFPQLQQGFGGYNRIAESLEVANRSPDRQRFFNDWILGGQLAWELDFWGQFRRNLAASEARLDAQLEDYDDVLVILVSDVATAYIDYRTYEQRLTYARQNLAIQTESVRLARIKVEAGTRESDLDLPQAQADLANIQALIPDLEQGRRQAMNRLSVLLGLPPGDLSALLGTGPIPVPPPDLALGIPADLLRQRPDVRRAERDLAAQCEEIGIAVADLYPHISINGTIFVNSEKFSDLFTPKSWGGAVGPAFRWDILNYGRLRANIRLQEARFNELVYTYQQKVLKANEEVENSISSFLYSHERVNAYQTGATASVDAVEIGTKRYKDGVSDFNRLSNLQVVLARQQDSLAFSQGEVAQSWVDVYRSLGGGWQIRLADARPYKPGISPETGTDSLPSPDPALPAPSKPETVPDPVPQATTAPPQQAPGSVSKDSDQPKPTIGSRLAALKNFLLHRKAIQANAEPQISQDPLLQLPELLAPESIEPDADWSDLAEASPTTPREKQYVGTPVSAPTSAPLAIAAAPAAPRVFSEQPTTESVIEIAKIKADSASRSEARIALQSIPVRSNPARDLTQPPSQVEIMLFNTRSSRRVEAIDPTEPLPDRGTRESPEVSPSTIAFAPVANARFQKPRILKPQAPQPLAIETTQAKQPDDRLAVTPLAGDDVPNITFDRQPRSSRRLNVLDPKYIR